MGGTELLLRLPALATGGGEHAGAEGVPLRLSALATGGVEHEDDDDVLEDVFVNLFELLVSFFFSTSQTLSSIL